MINGEDFPQSTIGEGNSRKASCLKNIFIGYKK